MQAVIGPEQVAKRTEPLKNTGNELRTSNEKGGDLYELNRLGPGLDRAANGVSQIRNGLARAAGGAGLLAEGSGNAEEGALQIADGLGEAIAAATKRKAESEELNEGAGKVTEGPERKPRKRPGSVQRTYVHEVDQRTSSDPERMKQARKLKNELARAEAADPSLEKASERAERARESASKPPKGRRTEARRPVRGTPGR